eukprot:CAMPEP_0113444834 /NCGR_PEP_ID=MMETSP0014_2-20120614/2872_1 /TAXON_ID=2857 /ORGANISM="Nitzschia sp." /LENGTH=269 /DNA_ID=CAMNT_0000335861 /DNA_START=206 /DNA_END=1012 /DNA_ORIENTATION=- /assembly_acc=CAM_ASM_000159
MAAVLCTSISELCSASCNAVGQVLCLPFKVCDKVVCDTIINGMVCTPFMPYLVVTYCLFTPALVYAFKSLDNNACPELFSWLLVNAALSAAHMVAAFYIVRQIRTEPSTRSSTSTSTSPAVAVATPQPARTSTIAAITGLTPVVSTSTTSAATKSSSSDYKLEEGNMATATATPVTVTAVPATPYGQLNDSGMTSSSAAYDDTEAYSFGRVKHVLCYDHGMALYIVVIVVWAIWLAVGLTRRFDFDFGNEVCDELVGYLNVTIICGYLW